VAPIVSTVVRPFANVAGRNTVLAMQAETTAWAALGRGPLAASPVVASPGSTPLTCPASIPMRFDIEASAPPACKDR